MKPSLVCLSFVSAIGLSATSFAGEVVSPTVSASNAEKAAKLLTGRQRCEAKLAQPAKLDFGDRKSVTLREILNQLREKQQLSLRLDIPTLTALAGPEAFQSSAAFRPAAQNYPLTNLDQPSVLSPAYVPASSNYAASGVPVVLTNAEGESPASATATSEGTQKPETAPAPGSEAASQPIATAVEDAKSDDNLLETCLDLEINIQTINTQEVTVGTMLRHALDAVPNVFSAATLEVPLPITVTNACLLDYLVEDDGILITTRMAALSSKETRVYSVKKLSDATPEQLAKIIRQTIRPWSWRTQLNEFGDQLRGSVAIPASAVQSAVTTGVQLAASEVGATVSVNAAEGASAAPAPLTSNDAEKLGNAAINGLVTLAQASLSALEMVHYAEFPTASIQTMPGKLIIRQSQAAHREIADLLQQLSDAE